MNKKHLFHHWEINQCSTFLECLLYFNIFSTRKGTNLCHLTKADMVQDEVVMTLELNIPICLEKMAGNDEKIVVRQQPIFKGKALILANNDDDKLLHKENGKSHQHNRTSRVLNTQNKKKKRIYKSWRSHDILDGSEDMNWVQEAEADTLEQVEDNTE